MVEKPKLFLANIKFRTMGIFFTFAFIVAGLAYVASGIVIDKNVSLVRSAWVTFQADRSEKARLDSALRSALGYGGAIHEFKNYILRQEHFRHDLVQEKLGAVSSVIGQYESLGPTRAESLALSDIQKTVDAYGLALSKAGDLFKENVSAEDVDRLIAVDDRLAMRGLETLSRAIAAGVGVERVDKGKARLAVDLRAALGYGGFIHHFKNSVLRGDASILAQAGKSIVEAESVLKAYRALGLTPAEDIAVDDISSTLQLYRTGVDRVGELVAEGKTPTEIDRLVRVDDAPALRGIATLDREIAAHVESSSIEVTEALIFVSSLVRRAACISISVTIFIVIASIWLVRSRLVNPISHLIALMKKLSEGNYEVTISGVALDNEIGEMARSIEVFRVNGLKQREAEAQVKAVVDTVTDGIITINDKGIVLSFNPAAQKIFGYELDDVLGRNVKFLMPAGHRSLHDGYVKGHLEGAPARVVGSLTEQVGVREDGTKFAMELSVNEMRVDGRVLFTGVIRDITERKASEAEIERLAMTDPLTGLANRNRFEERLDDALKVAKRTDRAVGLLLIDLDKFKPVNDTYGHQVGDTLLKEVADRLMRMKRETDTVARLGGDEFSVILNSLGDADDADTPFNRISDELSRPFHVDGIKLEVGCSIGLSVFPRDSVEVEDLIRKADMAMYYAKQIKNDAEPDDEREALA